MTNGEEDYDINRITSMCSMLGPSSMVRLQRILYEPCPSFDEHGKDMTMSWRELNLTGNELVISAKIIRGEFSISGWRPLF